MTHHQDDGCLICKYGSVQNYMLKSYPDLPAPLFAGMTPRQAAHHPQMRSKLRSFLANAERTQAPYLPRLGPLERIDYAAVRRELGL